MFDSKFKSFFRRCTRQRLMKKKPLSESGTEIMFGNIYGRGHFAQEMYHFSVRPNLQKLTNGRSVKVGFIIKISATTTSIFRIQIFIKL
jgi:hypothetical protein